ncbi:PQQ-like beta-propeller repeat protein [Wielerella bovis]|uniref:PQQ-like beta-propeller repeat protein n=1 Tax=Wielerella bovis TaxID=2917790 RepID=UPI00201912BE|nr:PQQ-like beta-propeller repeat protein [Wielerella bovis]ULJ65108.1 PQQ-like beta-propeller repeat protein [Wielerella bovis]ULJ67382.1 PQQ-like beta-propeller repeat protein [Wielerella bovis]
MNFKKLTLLPLLLILNACRAEPNFAQTPHENKLLKIVHTEQSPFNGNTDFLPHSGCLIAIQQNGHFYPARICEMGENEGGTQTVAAAEDIVLLPDRRPIAFGNNILLLGDPDSETYPHGVLGDAIEAKTLYTLDAKTLKPAAAAFRLPENLVFENNTVTLWGDKVVAVISGGGAGARVAVLALTNGHWQIQAESAPLPTNRWQSPFVFQNQLYAVQMPHLRGRLVRYEMQGKRLIEQELGDSFSNHAIGSRDTQIAAVLPDYVVIPQMGYRRLVTLDSSGSLKRLEPELPAPVVRSAVQDGVSYWLLSDGSVWAWAQPER